MDLFIAIALNLLIKLIFAIKENLNELCFRFLQSSNNANKNIL